MAGSAKFVFLDCSDALYYAHVREADREQEFDVRGCLTALQLPPLRDFFELFSGRDRLSVQHSMLLGGQALVKSWLFFVRHGCAPLWPAHCSVCAQSQASWQSKARTWFHGIIESLAADFRGPLTPGRATPKRTAWADVEDDESEKDFVAEEATYAAAGDTSLWTATSSTPGPQPRGSVAAFVTGQSKTKPKKKVQFSEAAPEVVDVARSELCWRLEVDVARQALLSLQAVPSVEEQPDSSLLLQVVDGHHQKHPR